MIFVILLLLILLLLTNNSLSISNNNNDNDNDYDENAQTSRSNSKHPSRITNSVTTTTTSDANVEILDEDSSDSDEDIENALEVGQLPVDDADVVVESEEALEEEAVEQQKDEAAHHRKPPTATAAVDVKVTPKPSAARESPLRVHSDCTRFTNAAAATECINVVRGRAAEFSCETVDELVQQPHPFSYGQRKAAFHATFRGKPVVVKRPRKILSPNSNAGKETDFELFRNEAYLFAALVATRDSVDPRSMLDSKGRMLMAPHYYGVCLEQDSLMAVVELAIPLGHLNQIEPLAVSNRIGIAVGILNIAEYLRYSLPLGSMVHCDIHHRQIALIDEAANYNAAETNRRRYRPVMLDLDGLQPARLASLTPCTIDRAVQQIAAPICEQPCFKAWHYAMFNKLFESESSIFERLCGDDGFCHGYTPSFNDWTLGAYTLWELFTRDNPAIPPILTDSKDTDFRQLLRTIITSFARANPNDRGKVTDARNTLITFATALDLDIGVEALTTNMLGLHIDATNDNDKTIGVASSLLDNIAINVDHLNAENDDNSKMPDLQALLGFVHLLNPIQLETLMSEKDRNRVVAHALADTERFVNKDAMQQFGSEYKIGFWTKGGDRK